MVQDTREEDTSLPRGWEKWLCHASGLFYFYDRTTKCRQWGRPGRTTGQQLVEMTEQFVQRMMHQLNEMNDKLDGNMRTLWGETQSVGQCLQADKMAPPRGDTMEPARGSVDCVGPAGEDRVIRETCWARREKVTVTVTKWEKLNGVTETCTAGRQVTELTETREVEERLHGVEEEEDAHTHACSEA